MLRFTITILAILISAAATLVAASPDHKVLAPPGSLSEIEGVSVLQDYGAFVLYSMTEATWASRNGLLPDRAWNADFMDRLQFTAGPFDTQRESLMLAEHLMAEPTAEPTLRLIQFVGPIRESWLRDIRRLGAEPVHYIANNGYLVWADGQALAALQDSARNGGPIQFTSDLPAGFKLSSALFERLGNATPFNPDEIIPVIIQMLNHGDKENTENIVKNLLVTQTSEWTPVLAYQNITGTARVGALLDLARRGDVTHVGRRLARQLNDEVQSQIIAGNLVNWGEYPTGPGYHAFLEAFGLPTSPSAYPLLDISDTGLGNGSINTGDPTLHEDGLITNPTRIAYVNNCTAAATGEDIGGHGHINTSIAIGFDQRSGFPFRDPDGYQRGHGINPWGRVGSTRLFAPTFDTSACGGSDMIVIKSIQDTGAMISSNSWGCAGCAGSYDTSSQIYDLGTMDSDTTEAGYQEMIFFFGAGNSGPGSGTINTPGNAKNVITIGASESYRPSDEDGDWTDGCGAGPTNSDHAMQEAFFTSRGPAPGGRAKPELIAPGTHIQGTASTSAGYDGSGVCDAARPSGQTVFAASSGTSHSTPAVAGLGTLVYWWIENGHANPSFTQAPSPAMMKAYLIGHTTHLTQADWTLPGDDQGFGMPAHELLFDGTPTLLIDQSVVFDNSGEVWTWTGARADPSKAVRIVLAYTDYPGYVGTSPQVNNLDLSGWVGGSYRQGNNFAGPSTPGGTHPPDPDNNYEAIFVPSPNDDLITITITATNIAGNGAPGGDMTDQNFALVCYNCRSPDLFSDGFEIGDSSQWDTVVP